MSDMIKKAAVLLELKLLDPRQRCFSVAVDIIKNFPAIDAVPVVHGRWETFKDVLGFSQYQCSECGDEWRRDDKNRQEDFIMCYCPNCGAKMDGGEDDEAD